MNVQEIIDTKKCSGCELCANICPQKAIGLKENEEGFVYPRINLALCTSCSLCVNKCPIVRKKERENRVDSYAAYVKDEKILSNSSSGGIASLLIKTGIERGMKVASVIYGDDFREAFYYISSEISDLELFRGTKYVQSRKYDIYIRIIEILRKGHTVLFIGLPCEVAALKSCAEKYSDNLYTIELVCHGVTSPKVLRQYIDKIEKSCNRIRTLNVRYKKYGWTPPCIRVEFEDGKVSTKLFDSTAYGYAFRNMSRKSCYDCYFKGENSVADITIGDYWGIDSNDKMWNADGVSVVFLRTNKGRELFNSLKGIKKQKIEYDDAIRRNPCVEKSRGEKKDFCRSDYVGYFLKGDIFIARKKTEKMREKTIRMIRNFYYRFKKNRRE